MVERLYKSHVTLEVVLLDSIIRTALWPNQSRADIQYNSTSLKDVEGLEM